jgi:hypothetical protein
LKEERKRIADCGMRSGGKKIKKFATANPSVGGEDLGGRKRSTKIYFVLPTLHSGSTVSASSGGQLRKSVVRKTKHRNGGKNYGITRFNTRCNEWEK